VLQSFVVCIIALLSFTDSAAAVDSVRQRNRNKLATDTSELVTVNRVLILGNKITRDFIIQRELTLKSGDTVRVQKLPLIQEKDKSKLLNTRLFNTITIKVIDYENGTIDLLVEVSERWYTFPVPILELADRNFNEWWQNYNHDLRRLNYGIKLYQYNVRGRNETLLLTAKFGFTKIFRVSYRMPYLDKKRKQGLTFDVNYEERKNVAYRTVDNILTFAKADQNFKVTRSGGITYTYRNTFYHFHSFSLDAVKNQISDSLVQLNPEYYGNSTIKTQTITSLSYQYIYEHRDFVTYPLKGSYFSGTIRQQGILKGDDLIKTDLNAGYAKYMELGKKYYLSNFSNAYVSFQTHIPYGNYSALGYSRQFVRGYEVYLIEGPQFVFNKTTLKKRLFSKTFDVGGSIEQFRKIPLAIYLKTYADLGYVWNYPGYEAGERLTDKLLTGIGGGVDLITSHDATMRLEYSFNGEGENGFFFHLKKEF
jgi:outer membrane protein assembly factor BamA